MLSDSQLMLLGPSNAVYGKDPAVFVFPRGEITFRCRSLTQDLFWHLKVVYEESAGSTRI